MVLRTHDVARSSEFWEFLRGRHRWCCLEMFEVMMGTLLQLIHPHPGGSGVPKDTKYGY